MNRFPLDRIIRRFDLTHEVLAEVSGVPDFKMLNVPIYAHSAAKGIVIKSAKGIIIDWEEYRRPRPLLFISTGSNITTPQGIKSRKSLSICREGSDG